MSDQILRTDALRVGYGEKTVVEALDLRAEGGRIMTLIGPNGAGKSTILKTIIRQLAPLGGAVWLSGRELARLSQTDLARESAAVLTERPRPELMTCRDVISVGRYPHTGRLGVLTEADRAVVRDTIRLVGLEDVAEQDFDRISDGQRQRVMLARALCQEPKLLVLDEPTSYLDIRSKLEFLHLLRELVRERQLAVVMSLHELDLAQRFSDQIVCIRDGRADRVGTPEEIFAGDYIERLYGVAHGSFDPLFGVMEPAARPGPPEIFVIGGGGSGVPAYRRLWRMGVSFAAGVLHENDLDYPAARALASAVITERAFEPIGEACLSAASELLLTCRTVLCPLQTFGPGNEANRRLRALAAEHHLLQPADAFFAAGVYGRSSC